jgi:ubiquinone/menaquinone biosynthesis C-methylase UbiE
MKKSSMENKMKRDFDSEAATWDDNPGRVMNARAIANAIIGQVPLSGSMDALDYGAGTGLVTLALSPLVRSIVAADSAPAMLERLQQKAAASGLANVTTLALDLERHPAPSLSFDLVVSTLTMHHITDVEKVLRILCGFLRPGGHLAIADLDPDDGEFHAEPAGVAHHGFERESFRRLLTECGLVDVVVETANRLEKPVDGKGVREFSVFLATGRKP